MSFSLFSAIFVVFISGFIGTQAFYNKKNITPMTGMMITMSLAMMVPLTIGVTFGLQTTHNPTLSTIHAVIFGLMVGYIVGHPFGILAQLEGVFAGIMGGLMGPMTGLMISNQNPYLFIGFFHLVFMFIMLMIYRLIQHSAPQQQEKKSNLIWWFFLPSFLCILLLTLYQTNLSSPLNANSSYLATQKKAYQESIIQVSNNGYSPQQISLKQGVPAILHFRKKDIGGCLSYLIFPTLHIHQELKKGDNIIRFTPRKTGTFIYTCGMGMYHGYITIN